MKPKAQIGCKTSVGDKPVQGDVTADLRLGSMAADLLSEPALVVAPGAGVAQRGGHQRHQAPTV